jgi:hypothetical protein
MYLRRLLPAHIAYYPVDHIPQCEQTIVCDFNKQEFPDLKADVAFLSEILEYISDVEWFFNCISNRVNKIILSYSCMEAFPDLEYRQSHGWQNNLTTDEIYNRFPCERVFVCPSATIEKYVPPCYVLSRQYLHI